MGPVALIKTHKLYKTFMVANTPLTILNDITVSFASSSTYALTGASGSGKSTLVHLLAGLDKPSSGSIFFNDQNINTYSTKQAQHYLNRSVGLMFQQPYLIPELSALENIMLPGLIAGKPFNASKKEATLLLEYINLAHKQDVTIRSLSGGQQQRVSLGRALFNKPAFLIADEPTGNLDTHTARDMIDLLLDCHLQWKMGIIISTHDEYVAQKMQTLYHLDNGHLALIPQSTVKD